MDGAQFLTWNGAGFDTVAYSTALGGWIDLSNLNPANPPSLPPGKGFFFYNPQSTVSPMTFVGKVVPALCATNYLALPTGFSLIGSPLPAEVIDLLLPPVSLPLIYDMCVYERDPFGGGYDGVYYSGIFGGWLRPGEWWSWPPDNRPGKAFFFYNPGPATTWPQSLSCP
jgi:hypothetical protein